MPKLSDYQEFKKSLFENAREHLAPKAEKYEPSKKDILRQVGYKIKEMSELKNMRYFMEQDLPEVKELAEKYYGELSKELTKLISDYPDAVSKSEQLLKAVAGKLDKLFEIPLEGKCDKCGALKKMCKCSGVKKKEEDIEAEPPKKAEKKMLAKFPKVRKSLKEIRAEIDHMAKSCIHPDWAASYIREHYQVVEEDIAKAFAGEDDELSKAIQNATYQARDGKHYKIVAMREDNYTVEKDDKSRVTMSKVEFEELLGEPDCAANIQAWMQRLLDESKRGNKMGYTAA